MAMNCTEFEQELIEQVEASDALWSEGAARHLAECPRCRSSVKALSTLDQAITAWKSTPLPSPPTEKLVAILRHEAASLSQPMIVRSERPSSTQWSAASWMTTAAACTLLLMGWTLWKQPAIPQPDSGLPALASSADETLPVTTTVADLWHGVRDRSATVARQTLSSWDQMPAIAPMTNTELPPNLDPDFQPVMTQHSAIRSTSSELLSGWSNLSKPIGQQVGTALQFLGQVIPTDPPPAS